MSLAWYSHMVGKPPDFALEVACPTTCFGDYTYKRNRYAELGIPEYWRFDPGGGEYQDTALAGGRMGIGSYDPIEIETIYADMFCERRDVLGLDICWEHGQRHFHDPAEGRYLMTFDEEADGRLAAEAEVRRLRDELSRLQSESETQNVNRT